MLTYAYVRSASVLDFEPNCTNIQNFLVELENQMATKIVNVPNVGQVKLFKRKGSRSIRLSLGRNGDIRVTLPYWVPYSAGVSFALSKQSWIAVQKQKITSTQLWEGQTIGRNHQLHFVASASTSRTSGRISNEIITVTYPARLDITDQAVQKSALRASQKALTLEAEQALPARLAELAEQYGYSYNQLSFKRLSSRWGSCDNHKNIILNIYLMTLPQELIDYVIMHELNHTVVLQHGPKFWHELEKNLPDARSLSKQLHTHAPHFS